MSNFSNDVCPDEARSIYAWQCWDFLLPGSPMTLDLIYYLYSLAWSVDIFRELATLLIIFFYKNSEGISCKAQIMYVLSGICRFSNDFEANEWIFFFPKCSYLVFAFGLLIVAFTFRSQQDQKYDDQSLPLLVFGCILIALVPGIDRLSMTLVHLSLILEAGAMIAQCSLNQNKRAESLTVRFFLNSWFYGKILMNVYYGLLSFVSLYRIHDTHDAGFRHFGTHSYHNINYMMLGELVYLCNHILMRQIRKKKVQKPKKFEQLIIYRSDQ